MCNDRRNLIKTKLNKYLTEDYSNNNPNEKPETWVPCPRCGGSGQLMHYLHINAGKCYECGGSGVVPNFKVPEIKEKMRLAKIKKDAKRAEDAAIQRAENDETWRRRNAFAVDFNQKVLDKVIYPRIDMSSFYGRKDFEQMEGYANHLNITNGEDFVKNMKPIFKIMFDPFFTYQMGKYLKEKYNYDYIGPNKNYFDDYSSVSPDIQKTIQALQIKYRSEYES